MALTIHQEPLYDTLHAGEKIIFTLRDLNAVTNFVKVKYIARIYVADYTSDLGTSSNLNPSSGSLKAVLKSNPNNAASGIFDCSPVVDNYVSPDFEGGEGITDAQSFFSSFKGVAYDTEPHDIHLIDAFTSGRNATKFVRVIFNMEYAVNHQAVVTETTSYKVSDDLLVFNGYLENHEILKEVSGNFGYNLNWNNYILNGSEDKFLTEAPTTQYIREGDYATIAFFNNLDQGGTPGTWNTGQVGSAINRMVVKWYYNGAQVGGTINTNIWQNGAFAGILSDATTKLHYFGIGVANLNNNGASIPANWDYYTLHAEDGGNNQCSQTYYFYQQEDDCKGYETIRLGWINKFGTWDYYNFTQKSIRTFSKDAVSYQSMEGTWNEEKFKYQGYRGGKKIFKSKATEIITLNTNFITDEEAIWLESLFVSNNVYIINKNSFDANNQGKIRKYVEPVFMASAELERQTTANNGKKQYTFSINKSKMRKTHRT